MEMDTSNEEKTKEIIKKILSDPERVLKFYTDLQTSSIMDKQ